MHIISGGDSGGAKTHLLNLCIQNRRFENVIGCINKGVLYEEAYDLSLNTVLFEQYNRADLKVTARINEYINKNGIDIVNFHGARANFLHMFLKRSLSIPGVTTVHSDYRYDFSNNNLKQAIFTPMNAMSLKMFDSFICVSRKILVLLNEKGFKGKKYIVQNGIDPGQRINKSRDEIRDTYGIPKDAFLFTMVARFHPVKNHRGFIDAANKLISEHPDVWLLLVGSGDLEYEIKSRVKNYNIDNRVIFTGMQCNVLDYFNAGDVNILTSFNETFPIVILEGALVKKAAVCSNVGDMEDLLDEQTGFIINPNSVDDIYDKMKQAYEYKDMLYNMGDKLYDKVINEFTIDKFSEKYYNAYKAIISGENNG